MTFKFIYGIGKYAVRIVEIYILHLRSKIYPLRLCIKLKRNCRTVNRFYILNYFKSQTAFYGSCVKQMIYISVLRILIHKSYNTERTEICRKRFVVTQKNVYNVLDNSFCYKRTLLSIFIEQLKGYICAVIAERHCGIGLCRVIWRLRVR